MSAWRSIRIGAACLLALFVAGCGTNDSVYGPGGPSISLQPDLFPEDVKVLPDPALAGSQAKFLITIANQGGVDAGTFRVRVSFWNGPYYAFLYSEKDYTVPFLQASTALQTEVILNVPSDRPSNWLVVITVDVDDSNDEINEANNAVGFPFTAVSSI